METTSKYGWLERIKIHPVGISLTILALILLLAGGLAELYGLINRPDLRYRLSDIPVDMTRNNLDLIAYHIDSIRTGKPIDRILFRNMPDGYYDSENDTFRFDVECCLFSRDTEPQYFTVPFEFRGHPQSAREHFPFTSSFYNLENHFPLAAHASYKDEIRIIVKLVDIEGNISSTSKTIIDFPPEAIGSTVDLGIPVEIQGLTQTRELATTQGNQEYLALSLGHAQFTANHYDWIKEPHKEGELDPSMQAELGLIITPSWQPEWESPYEIIPLPAAPSLKFAKPYGEPGLFMYTGGSNNNWYTLPDRETDDPVQAEHQTTSDFWTTFYLYDINTGEFKDSLRPGEIHPEIAKYYRKSVGYSNHISLTAATEFAIIAWPREDFGHEGILYNWYTESDVVDYEWWFAPEEPHEIMYDHVIRGNRAYSFEDIEQRIGFIMINTDGSTVMMKQKRFYDVQQIFFDVPAVKRGDTVDHFSDFWGVVPTHDGGDGFFYTTASDHVLVLNDSGEIIHDRPLLDHFLFDNNIYKFRTALYARFKSSSPVIIGLQSVEGNHRICRFEKNPYWISGWDLRKTATWITLLLLFVVLASAIMAYYKNRGIFSYTELRNLVTIERAARKQVPAYTASMQASIHSAVFHEMGNVLSTVRAFLQRDYRLISEIKETINGDDFNRDEVRELLNELKGREKYEQIIHEAVSYLEIMRNISTGSMELSELVDKFIKLNRNLFLRNNIEVETEISSSGKIVPAGIKIIFDSLTSNAIDAVRGREAITESGTFSGRIKIGISEINRKTVVTFQDNGVPLTDRDGNNLESENFDRIFESSFTTKDPGEGHKGLGLAIAREFALRHGWALYVDNQTDSGFTKRFVIEIK